MDLKHTALTGLRLPANSPVFRESPVPKEHQNDPGHQRAFDARTLFYDCVYLESEGGFLFTAPRFLNLWPVFKAGLRMNSRPVRRLRHRSFGRCDQVLVRGSPQAVLRFEGAGLDTDIIPRRQDPLFFEGGNLLVTKSRDNDLEWIQEWLRFHVLRHGANGLIFFDNGSTAYGRDELVAAFEVIDGLRSTQLVHVPFPYGDKFRAGQVTYSLAWLQMGLQNLSRRDMAVRARATLHCDIDEFVLNSGGQSVFDAAVQSPFKGVMIAGDWVYPPPETELPCAPHQNTWRAVPDRKCNRKWCAVPSGFASRLGGWTTHSFGGGFMRPFRMMGLDHPDFRLAHCSGTTTGWKRRSARFERPTKTAHDPVLEAALSSAIPNYPADAG